MSLPSEIQHQVKIDENYIGEQVFYKRVKELEYDGEQVTIYFTDNSILNICMVEGEDELPFMAAMFLKQEEWERLDT